MSCMALRCTTAVWLVTVCIESHRFSKIEEAGRLAHDAMEGVIAQLIGHFAGDQACM